MTSTKHSFWSVAFALCFSASLFALPMNSGVVSRFKKSIVASVSDALRIRGEFKNNSYYVNLREGTIKGHIFQNVIVKFDGLTKKAKESFLTDGVTFDKIKRSCSIKVAADISPEEFQQIVKDEILRSSNSRKIFSDATFLFEDNKVSVSGSINLKKVPGNPFAIISTDTFSPFNAKITAYVEGSLVKLSIIEGSVNGQEMTEELKNMLLGWLNPLFDFSKLDFKCGINSYKISPQGLRITGFLF